MEENHFTLYNFRVKTAKVSAWSTLISWIVLLIIVNKLKYVGVKIQYILIPAAILAPIFWYLINPSPTNKPKPNIFKAFLISLLK